MSLVVDLDIKDYLKPDIDRLNDSLATLAGESKGFLRTLLEHVLMNSGKRVRPALVFLSSKLGRANPEHVQLVAMIVELIHIATLVHDDVIDKAVVRRGQETVVAKHGVDASVLLGDHIYTYAFQQIVDLESPVLLKLLSRSASVMCSGEIDQMENRYRYDLSEEAYFSFIQRKTAALFGAAARAGAILANQPLEVQSALEAYGVHLGMAFQIKDDLLDLTGEERVVGKTLRTDLVNGKMTLPLIHFRTQQPSPEDFDRLVEPMKSADGPLSQLVDQLRDAGSIHYAEEKAHYHIREALNQLGILGDTTIKAQFVSLSDLLLRRKN